jgi:hypothetical protein
LMIFWRGKNDALVVGGQQKNILCFFPLGAKMAVSGFQLSFWLSQWKGSFTYMTFT